MKRSPEPSLTIGRNIRSGGLFSKLVPILAIGLLTTTFSPVTNAAALSISGNLPGVPANATDPGAWINGFYTLALMFGGVLAFGAVVYGGVLYAASAGNPSQQTEGKQWIWAALTGLLLLAGAWVVLNAINPSLTNVSFPTLSSLTAIPQTGGGAPGSLTGQSGIVFCQGSTAGVCADTSQFCSCVNGSCSCQSSNITCAGTTSGTCPAGRQCVGTYTQQGSNNTQVINYNCQ